MLTGGIPFIVGLLGIILFVLFRFFEEQKEQRFFAAVRKDFDRWVARLYKILVFGEFPHRYRAWTLQAVQHFIHSIVVFMVATLRKLERPLSRMSHRMRSARTKNGTTRDPSSFLKTITPEKKSEEDGKNPSDSV